MIVCVILNYEKCQQLKQLFGQVVAFSQKKKAASPLFKRLRKKKKNATCSQCVMRSGHVTAVSKRVYFSADFVCVCRN